MKTQISVREIPISRISVAGGYIKTAEQALRLAPKRDFVAEWGSITTKPSGGNGGRDYHAGYVDTGLGPRLAYAVNSIGLSNPGMAHVEEHAPIVLRAYREHGKELPINISGTGVDDTLDLLERALACGFRIVSVNGACPNREEHPILCDDTDAVTRLVSEADRRFARTRAVILFKTSLGMSRVALQHCAETVENSDLFTGLITGNTIRGAQPLRPDGSTAIKTENGIDRGGLSGPMVYGQAVEDTMLCAQVMRGSGKIVVGCGGVENAYQAAALIRAGACAVQVMTAFRENGEKSRFISGMLEDLESITE